MRYDFFKCEICGKIKKAGNEKVKSIAFSQKNCRAQNKEARLEVYYMLACKKCCHNLELEEQNENYNC